MKLLTLKRAAAFALLAGASAAHAQNFVTEIGDFSPLPGFSSRPYQFLSSAIWENAGQSTIIVDDGLYPETRLEPGRTVRIQAAGLVEISPVAAARTTFSAVSYNTHLFGDSAAGLKQWMDDERAAYIGDVLAAENPDIVGLNEVWDGDHLDDMLNGSWFFWLYGDANGPHPSHSGLLMMSDLPLFNPAQVNYPDGVGWDFFANKGFLRATVIKDGFGIGVFVTHTQAGNGDSEVSKRLDQLAQLSAAISAYRIQNPTHVVIAMGDLNVDGLTGMGSEYITNMRPVFNVPGIVQARDTAPNTPFAPDADLCTSCHDNELHEYFDGGGSDTRLDYFLYCDSFDGLTRVIPRVYERRRYQIPAQFPPLSHDGLTTRTLSDHDGLYGEFELIRY